MSDSIYLRHILNSLRRIEKDTKETAFILEPR